MTCTTAGVRQRDDATADERWGNQGVVQLQRERLGPARPASERLAQVSTAAYACDRRC
jgi:hypothetical protein